MWSASTTDERVLEEHADTVSSVVFSRDGTRLLTSSDATAKVWDTVSGRELVRLEGHAGHVLAAAFSPDGRQVLTGGMDMTARLWDAATGRPIVVLKGHTGRAAWARSIARDTKLNREVAIKILIPIACGARGAQLPRNVRAGAMRDRMDQK